MYEVLWLLAAVYVFSVVVTAFTKWLSRQAADTFGAASVPDHKTVPIDRPVLDPQEFEGPWVESSGGQESPPQRLDSGEPGGLAKQAPPDPGEPGGLTEQAPPPDDFVPSSPAKKRLQAGRSGRSGGLSRRDIRRGMILREILGPPRSLRPHPLGLHRHER